MGKILGKPQADDDVINREPRVLLIGYGWVGQYMGQYFKSAHYVTSEGIIRRVENDLPVMSDKNKKSPYPDGYDLAIIGVPTPMDPETGRCDISTVESAVEKWKDVVKYFLIKSTVEIGTTEWLGAKLDVNIAMSPEYVGETLGHPLLEPRRDAFQIIGGKPEVAEAIAGFFHTVLHASAPILIVSAREAEIIKYCENLWIMQRVDYWNDVFEVCKTAHASFNKVREGIVLDPRMSRTHSFVYPNNRGWSGKCLPKDMNALVWMMRQAGNPLETVEHQIEKNADKWRGSYTNKERLIPEKPAWQKK